MVTLNIIDFHENLNTHTNMKIKLFEMIMNIVLELYQYGILIPQMYPCYNIQTLSYKNQFPIN